MKIIKTFLVAFLATFLWFNLSGVVLAMPEQFSAEGEYRLGDRDTREDAKKYALDEAKRKIVEQAGVYIESYTEVNNFQVSQDKIKFFAQAVISVKSEKVEFLEGGLICKAYVTATIDMANFEKKLLELIKKYEKTSEKQTDEKTNDETKSNKRTNDRNTNDRRTTPIKTQPTNNKIEPYNTSSNIEEFDTKEDDIRDDGSIYLAELEKARSKMIKDLSKVTAYTAGSEYKIQEVVAMTHVGNHAEKGNISNYLKENYEMNPNYRFAELTPFVEEVGSKRIIERLNQVDKKKSLDARDRMTWAKIERTRAKGYGEIVLKEATALFERADELMFETNGAVKERIKVIRLEADDAIKLIKALEIRNKAMDEVAKKYEKANKITAKKDINPPKDIPKKKKNIFEELFK